MALKSYFIKFGVGDPRTYTGLSPTFLIFQNQVGATLAPPGISESLAGSGFYQFNYDLSGLSTTIAFLIDGFTSSIPDATRYISDSLSPNNDIINQGVTVSAIGFTQLQTGVLLNAQGATLLNLNTILGSTLTNFNTVLGSTLSFINSNIVSGGSAVSVLDARIGTTASSFGSTSADPGTLFGFLKRTMEFLEGVQTFNKPSGTWDVYSRGASTLLREKTLTNSVTGVTSL